MPRGDRRLGNTGSMTCIRVSGAEELARELLWSAQAKSVAVADAASAAHPPAFAFVQFPDVPDLRGLVDDYATVIEVVLKHSLACEYMRKRDTRRKAVIECEMKRLGHNAQRVFQKLSESTQEAIRSVYGDCLRGYDDFASIFGGMADFEEMLRWVKRGPSYRYTMSGRVNSVPICPFWSPRGTTEIEELPSFPRVLVDWADEQFRNDQPVRSLRDELEANLLLQTPRGDASWDTGRVTRAVLSGDLGQTGIRSASCTSASAGRSFRRSRQ